MDHDIAEFSGIFSAIFIGIIIGLRHSTDGDHVVSVSTIIEVYSKGCGSAFLGD